VEQVIIRFRFQLLFRLFFANKGSPVEYNNPSVAITSCTPAIAPPAPPINAGTTTAGPERIPIPPPIAIPDPVYCAIVPKFSKLLSDFKYSFIVNFSSLLCFFNKLDLSVGAVPK